MYHQLQHDPQVESTRIDLVVPVLSYAQFPTNMLTLYWIDQLEPIHQDINKLTFLLLPNYLYRLLFHQIQLHLLGKMNLDCYSWLIQHLVLIPFYNHVDKRLNLNMCYRANLKM